MLSGHAIGLARTLMAADAQALLNASAHDYKFSTAADEILELKDEIWAVASSSWIAAAAFPQV
jgi:hypothetical protein